MQEVMFPKLHGHRSPMLRKDLPSFKIVADGYQAMDVDTCRSSTAAEPWSAAFAALQKLTAFLHRHSASEK